MDIIVYLCGMNFTSQIRYNPKTGRDERYYRLKESYRNALGHSCTRILLHVGFVDDLQPEEMRDISRALTYKYEHQDETELWPRPVVRVFRPRQGAHAGVLGRNVEAGQPGHHRQCV
jgi:hypothetical protein